MFRRVYYNVDDFIDAIRSAESLQLDYTCWVTESKGVMGLTARCWVIEIRGEVDAEEDEE